MKIILATFLCLGFVLDSFGSPLIFKISKEINSSEFVELATFDAAKYKSVRVLITNTAYTSRTSIDALQIQLNAAKREVERTQSDAYSRFEKEQAKTHLNEIQKIYDSSAKIDYRLEIISLDEASEDVLTEFSDKAINQSFLIDSPPSKLRIKITGVGKFKLQVWGTL